MRHVPEREQRTLLARLVRVGAVDEARIADQHVAGAHRHSDLVGVRGKSGIVRVLVALQLGRVRRFEMVKRMIAAVRARNNAEAAVFRRGVG